MSFNTAAPSGFNTNRITAAIDLLRQGFYAQAFLLLSKMQAESSPAAHFAAGLCHLHADEPDAAIRCFEQARQLLKAALPLSQIAAEGGATYIKLAQKQLDAAYYLNPIDPGFCDAFPKAAEQTVLLALIHVYRQKGMTEQAQKLAGGLVGPVFEEYKQKLQEGVADGHLHN